MPQSEPRRFHGFARLRALFLRDDSGATAVEFALIGAPFFAMLSFMLLGGHILWMAQSMDTAVKSISRQIRTGQAQTANMTMATFRNEICNQVATSPASCRQNLIIDVKRFDAPENINFNPPKKNDILDQSASTFQPGGREDYVIVKVYYVVDYLTNLASLLGSTTNLDIPLSATAAFRNEPF
ncbi:MAG: pilus assembly protein [Cohaesibacter sp.]|nr:pilus assembly protein [Cohaesibacter sp.]